MSFALRGWDCRSTNAGGKLGRLHSRGDVLTESGRWMNRSYPHEDEWRQVVPERESTA